MVSIEILNFHDTLSLFFLEFSKESAGYGHRLPKFQLEKNQVWVSIDLNNAASYVELCYIFYAIGQKAKEVGLTLDDLVSNVKISKVNFNFESDAIRVNNIDPKFFIISLNMIKKEGELSINWSKLYYWEGLVAVEITIGDKTNLNDVFRVFANIGLIETIFMPTEL
jgi:hypothetical protein